MKSRGIDAYQAFGTADLGMIAFETPAREGMVVNEDLIMEIVRPGTGDPVAPGDVGEIVVTSLDPQHPWIRLALGDLTAALPGASPCGRTNMRIKGWMGRADQTTKVKGMFVRPEQIAEIGKRHPELGRLRLVVTRSGESDLMTLKAETAAPSEKLQSELAASLRAVTKLGGNVELVGAGSLPNDGKVIADERRLGWKRSRTVPRGPEALHRISLRQADDKGTRDHLETSVYLKTNPPIGLTTIDAILILNHRTNSSKNPIKRFAWLRQAQGNGFLRSVRSDLYLPACSP